MGYTRSLTAVAIVAVVGCLPLMGESPLIVRDSVGTVVGQVLGMNPGGPGYQAPVAEPTLLIRHSGHFIIVSVDASRLFAGRTVVFSGAACSGQATIPLTDGTFGDLGKLAGRYYAVGPGNVVYVAERASAATSTAGFQSWARDSECQNNGSASVGLDGRSALPLVDLDTLFSAPYSLDLNPLVFTDGFESGDLNRWQ